LVGGDHLAREDLDLLAIGPGVIQRDGEAPVGEHGAGLTVRRHERHRTATAAGQSPQAVTRPDVVLSSGVRIAGIIWQECLLLPGMGHKLTARNARWLGRP
jgi:hypothetical protein